LAKARVRDLSALDRKSVYVTREMPREAMEILESRSDVEVWRDEMPPPKSLLIEKVKTADGLVCLLTEQMDEEVVNAAGPQLRGVSQVAVGLPQARSFEA
jgi:lactate dehydrogenase-like 2-hydroxyacid dehydrogenase